MLKKQDRTPVRTPAHIEQKYDLSSKDYSEIRNMATSAQNAADRAASAAESAVQTVGEMDKRVTALEEGGGGGMTMELLWENPSPTSEFATQELNVDCSAYDEIEIRCMSYAETNQFVLPTLRIKVGETGCITNASGTSAPMAGSIVVTGRTFKNNGTSITVNVGRFCSGTWTDNNKPIIPYKIYGIKGAS